MPPSGNRESDVEGFLKLSLERLGLQYVDMYLIHLPVGLKKDDSTFLPAKDKDGNFIYDYDTDLVSLWKVHL